MQFCHCRQASSLFCGLKVEESKRMALGNKTKHMPLMSAGQPQQVQHGRSTAWPGADNDCSAEMMAAHCPPMTTINVQLRRQFHLIFFLLLLDSL